jgi:predicted PurR-regulated permease PerM
VLRRYFIGVLIVVTYAATAAYIGLGLVLGIPHAVPLALGTAARLHPVLIIFCFLSGALLFGVIGVIMAVPVALTVKVTLALLYDEPAKQALAGE